jgi:hypothetical protein
VRASPPSAPLPPLRRVGPHAGSAQHRIDAGSQFPGAEGLRDVVVGAGVEALEGVDLLRPRGEHHDVRGTDLADAARGLEAVHAGEADIQRRHDRIVRADEVERVGTGRGGVHVESGLLQDCRKERADVLVILDDDRHTTRIHPHAFPDECVLPASHRHADTRHASARAPGGDIHS